MTKSWKESVEDETKDQIVHFMLTALAAGAAMFLFRNRQRDVDPDDQPSERLRKFAERHPERKRAVRALARMPYRHWVHLDAAVAYYDAHGEEDPLWESLLSGAPKENEQDPDDRVMQEYIRDLNERAAEGYSAFYRIAETGEEDPLFQAFTRMRWKAHRVNHNRGLISAIDGLADRIRP